MEELEFKIVPIEQVEPNPLNPNIMSERLFDMLKASIKQWGFIKPVLTVYNPETQKYLITDGAHRYLALKELGKGKIPIIVTKALTPQQAKLGSFLFNKIKGMLDAKKIAELLVNALNNYTKEEICKYIQMEKERFDEYTAMIREQEVKVETKIKEFVKVEQPKLQELRQRIVDTTLKEIKAVKVEAFKRLFSASLSEEDYNTLHKALSLFNPDPTKALIEMARWVLENYPKIEWERLEKGG